MLISNSATGIDNPATRNGAWYALAYYHYYYDYYYYYYYYYCITPLLLLLLRRASCVSGSSRQVHINGGIADQLGERDWHGAESGGVKQFDG